MNETNIPPTLLSLSFSPHTRFFIYAIKRKAESKTNKSERERERMKKFLIFINNPSFPQKDTTQTVFPPPLLLHNAHSFSLHWLGLLLLKVWNVGRKAKELIFDTIFLALLCHPFSLACGRFEFNGPVN
jgi:hypothetical protein